MEICLLELPEPGRRKVVPHNWLKALRGLGFWEPKPLLGDWFRSERERLGIARDLLAARQQGLARGACKADKPPAQIPPEWIDCARIHRLQALGGGPKDPGCGDSAQHGVVGLPRCATS